MAHDILIMVKKDDSFKVSQFSMTISSQLRKWPGDGSW